MLDLEDEATRRAAERLAPFAREVLDRAARHAQRLHATEVALEHFLFEMLRDEDSGAARLVLGAFADPQSMAIEVLALSPGILVVGSDKSLPFSPGSVLALETARRSAIAARASKITPKRLALAAVEHLDAAGQKAVGSDPGFDDEAEAGEPMAEDALVLAALTPNARRALGAACRRAQRTDHDAITPAHVVLGVGDVSESGSASHLDFALAGSLDDATPLPSRALPVETEFEAWLTKLETPIETVDLLRRVLADTTSELALLFAQDRITPALVERVGTAYEDPA